MKLQQNFPGSSKGELQDPEAGMTFVYLGKINKRKEGRATCWNSAKWARARVMAKNLKYGKSLLNSKSKSRRVWAAISIPRTTQVSRHRSVQIHHNYLCLHVTVSSQVAILNVELRLLSAYPPLIKWHPQGSLLTDAYCLPRLTTRQMSRSILAQWWFRRPGSGVPHLTMFHELILFSEAIIRAAFSISNQQGTP